MVGKAKELAVEAIVKPAKNSWKEYTTLILFIFGVALVIIGAVFGEGIDAWQFVPTGTGDVLLKSGSAIIGAGVFAVIMQSSQFTSAFQKHLYDVLYNPAKVFGIEELKKSWLSITNSILKTTLPQAHKDASNGIMEQFFDEELQYHFEDFMSTIDINVDKDGYTARIIQTTSTNLVISPHQKNPVVEQKVKVDGECRLTCLRINDVDIDTSQLVKPDPADDTIHVFTLPLKDHIRCQNGGGDDIVKMERTMETTQDLRTEPFLIATIVRYVKGFSVKVKISGHYELIFRRTGTGIMDEATSSNLPLGYKCWVLANRGTLLLPGQGYTIILNKVPS